MNTLSGHTKNLRAARNNAKARVEAARKIQTAYRAALARRRRAAAAKVADRAALARRRERVWRLMRELHMLLARGNKIITRAFTKFKRYEWTRALMYDMAKDSYEILVWLPANKTQGRVIPRTGKVARGEDLATILTAHTYLQLTLMARMQEEARGLPPKKQAPNIIKQLRRDYSAFATKFRGILTVLGRSYPHARVYPFKNMSDSTRKKMTRTLWRYGQKNKIRLKLWIDLFKRA